MDSSPLANEISKAIHRFTIPSYLVENGWRPSPIKNSAAFKYGVLIENEARDYRKWFCLVDDKCRNEHTCIKISGSSYANCNRHLERKHPAIFIALKGAKREITDDESTFRSHKHRRTEWNSIDARAIEAILDSNQQLVERVRHLEEQVAQLKSSAQTLKATRGDRTKDVLQCRNDNVDRKSDVNP